MLQHSTCEERNTRREIIKEKNRVEIKLNIVLFGLGKISNK